MRGAKGFGIAMLLVLSTAVSALSGAASAAPPPGWTAPTQIYSLDPEVTSMQSVVVAVAPGGRALAVWNDYSTQVGQYCLFYRWYEPGVGWGEQGLFYEFSGGALSAPTVAAAGNGDFLLAARAVPPSDPRYIATWVYDAEGGWFGYAGAPNTNPSTTDLDFPQVAVDPLGNGVVVWQSRDGPYWNVSANRYTQGAGWGAVEATVDVINTGTASGAQVVLDADGQATATFLQSDGDHLRIFASTQPAGGAWSTPEALDEEGTDVGNTELAVDAAGGVQAYWTQSNLSNTNVYASYRAPQQSWGSPAQVSTFAAFGAGFMRAAGGPAGTFAVAWHQFDGGEYQMMARLYASGAWSAPTNLTAMVGSGRGGTNPFVAVDAAGNAVVVWTQYGGGLTDRVFASWGGSASGWSEPARLDTAGTGALLQGFAMDADGHAVAVWKQHDGLRYEPWGATYSPPDVTPPPLDVSLPLQGAQLANATVLVCGITEPEIATVEVHGYRASPDPTGEFCLWIPLHPGNNTLWIIVTDAAGNEARTSRTVTYNDPVPGLQQDLAAAQAEADDAHAAAQQLGSELDAAEANLSQARNDLTIARNRISNVESDLDLLQNTTQQSATAQAAATNAAASAAATASLVGALGVLVGIAGAAMALLSMRKSAGGSAPEAPPKAPEAPKSEAPKADEPPK